MRQLITRLTIIVAVLVMTAILAACGSSNNFRDVENVTSQDPDKIVLFNNVDQHPNLVVMCIKGKAFMTANRDYKPWEREPDMDAPICGSSS